MLVTSLSLISGSNYYILGLYRILFGTQLQRLSSELNPLIDFPLAREDFYLSYLDGDWNLHNADLRRGALQLQETASMISSGYIQSGDDQAQLAFTQEHALLIMVTTLQVTGK